MTHIKLRKTLGEELGVDFVYRTMQDIHKESDGKPDEPHRHNFYTVIFAVKAVGKHVIDFNEYDFVAPSVFFVSPGQVHQVITEDVPSGHVFLFGNEFLLRHHISQEFISDLSIFRNYGESPPLAIGEQSLKELVDLALNIANNINKSSAYSLEKVAAYLKLFLINCAEICTLPNSEAEHSFGVDSIIKSFRKLVDEHFKQEHSVSFFAEKLFISTGHLNKTVKGYTGISAKEFIQKRITTEAKRLAIYSELSTKEIGFELGFDDPAHFSTFFKKCTGHSFTAYKKSIL